MHYPGVLCVSADRIGVPLGGRADNRAVALLTVHVNRPDVVDDLVASLRRSGCGAWRIGPYSCTVRHEAAVDEREARTEVTFFLRAWEARHHFVCALVAG